MHIALPSETGATLSPDRRYRYLLWRRWSGGTLMNWVMLNPSTADETLDDMTIKLCVGRARLLGHGGIVVTNLFAYRATDPAEMRQATDPVGPDNDAMILAAAARAGIIVCAWGNHGSYCNRAAAVKMLLRDRELHCLRLSKAGEPVHPLRISYQLPLITLPRVA